MSRPMSVLIAASLLAAAAAAAQPLLRGGGSAAAPTEFPATADILTPHNATQPAEAFTLLRDTLVHQMRAPGWQWEVCLITFVLGAIMLWKPKDSFKYIFVAVIFCVAYTVTMGDLHERYDVEQGGSQASLSNGVPIWTVVFSVEAALCFALVAWRGFRGIELIIGMSLAVWPLRELQGFMIANQILGDSHWLNVVILTVSAGIGIYMNAHDNHNLELLVSYLLPLVGGRLVSASVGTVGGFFLLGPSNLVWLDYWHSLPLGLIGMSRAADFNKALAGFPGIGWSTPHGNGEVPAWAGEVVGTLIWALLSGLAIWLHHKVVVKKQQELKERIRSEAESAGPRTLVKRLTEPLINLG